MKTLIIDNFDSFTYNLYQYLGELGGNPDVKRNDEINLQYIEKGSFTHLVISPGPGSPDDEKYFGICKEVILRYGKKIPLLGVCLGHQGIISTFGGKVTPAKKIMHGKKSKIVHGRKGIFHGVKNPLSGMRYHSLVGEKESIPSCLVVTAHTQDNETVMAVRHRAFPIYGVQFHPESIGTEDGKKILENFLKM
ncbi:aminodeoxychorismate/anthranilate synthase component II [Candidatus Gottesmanbacteria bacterium]|nr:aminodeoxychorismate/anthranilate synthase component II [Candidatus Gottesmanbacteria bacterium]